MRLGEGVGAGVGWALGADLGCARVWLLGGAKESWPGLGRLLVQDD